LITAFRAGLKVSGMLEATLPKNFQYFDGETHHFYLTNVGAHYGLLIVFPGEEGVGRMGTVVHYARRAVDELLDCLSGMASAAAPSKVEIEPVEAAGVGEAAPGAEIGLGVTPEAGADQDADRFWEEAVEESGARGQAEGEALTYEQARKLGLVPEELEEGDSPS
jgi:hypothetical protein